MSSELQDSDDKGFSLGSWLLIGAASLLGMREIGDMLSDHRYPMRVEYAIMQACANGSERYQSYSAYHDKQEQCFCMLEKTMHDVPYKTYQKDENSFTSTFSKKKKECSS